jgi:hypothetical protein
MTIFPTGEEKVFGAVEHLTTAKELFRRQEWTVLQGKKKDGSTKPVHQNVNMAQDVCS